MAEVNENVQNSDVEAHEEDFATLLEESFKAKESEVISSGKIIAIKGEEVYVNIDRKTESVMPIYEIQDENGELKFKEGDTIQVVTFSRNGKLSISHKKALRKDKIKEFIANFDEEAENILDIKVVSKNKGGYIVVTKDDLECFLPKSQSLFKESLNVIGKNFKVKVLKVDLEKQSIVVSRKKIIEDNRRKKQEIINKILENDAVIDGKVKQITTYGMFVDIGGIDGLVHYSEISYKGPVNPSTLYKEGDVVPVKVIKYENDRRQHLSLSIKAATIDPWEEIVDVLNAGDVINVVVSNIEPYGAFVDLGNDIEGFLHISEISWDKNIKNPKDFITEGQEIDVEVIEINLDERRLRVSLKNLLEKPFDAFLEKYNVGDVVKAEVTTITTFGAFLKIDSIEGLLHNENLSWDKNQKCKDSLNVGDVLEVKIIKIDKEDEKISLSLKDLEDSPIEKFSKNHNVGDIVNGTIRDIKDFGIFVELSDGVDALIRKEDIGSLDIENAKIGDAVEAAIAFIDLRRNRIRLSVRRLAKQKEREVLNEINSEERLTLGDLIKDQLK